MLAAAAALAAGAAVCVVALAFALFALTAPYVGGAGAAAIVAGAAALLIVFTALILMLAARPRRRKTAPATPATVVERVAQFLQDKPIVAIVGAIATGILAVRNPGYLGAAARAFMEGREHRRR